MAIIRKAVAADIPEILEIVERVHINNVKNLDNGFLMISNASPVLYKEWFSSSPYCYAAVGDGKVVGVLVALPNCAMDQKSGIQGWLIKNSAGREIAFIVQVAVDPAFCLAGIGRAMYERFFADAGGIDIFSTSLKKPCNKASRQFHLALGFKIMFFYSGDRMESYLYWLDNSERR